MPKFELPLLETRESLRNTVYEGMGELFRRHDGELILVTHDMTTGEYLSRQRYLQLGIISSRDHAVTLSKTHVYLPTTRFVWSLDNRDIRCVPGNIVLPIGVQPSAFLDIPLGVEYSRSLSVGTKDVEKWLADEVTFPYLQQDLYSRLGWPMPDEGSSFYLDLQFA
jgi:hypothetical protein